MGPEGPSSSLREMTTFAFAAWTTRESPLRRAPVHAMRRNERPATASSGSPVFNAYSADSASTWMRKSTFILKP